MAVEYYGVRLPKQKRKETDWTRFSIRILQTLNKELKRTAKNLNCTRNALLITAVEDYLKRLNEQ